MLVATVRSFAAALAVGYVLEFVFGGTARYRRRAGS